MADFIKRQDAMAVLTNALHGYESDEIYEKSVKKMENLPAIDIVDRKRGTWEFDQDGMYDCGICGYKSLHAFLYCPACGSEMNEACDRCKWWHAISERCCDCYSPHFAEEYRDGCENFQVHE